MRCSLLNKTAVINRLPAGYSSVPVNDNLPRTRMERPDKARLEPELSMLAFPLRTAETPIYVLKHGPLSRNTDFSDFF